MSNIYDIDTTISFADRYASSTNELRYKETHEQGNAYRLIVITCPISEPNKTIEQHRYINPLIPAYYYSKRHDTWLSILRKQLQHSRLTHSKAVSILMDQLVHRLLRAPPKEWKLDLFRLFVEGMIKKEEESEIETAPYQEDLEGKNVHKTLGEAAPSLNIRITDAMDIGYLVVRELDEREIFPVKLSEAIEVVEDLEPQQLADVYKYLQEKLENKYLDQPQRKVRVSVYSGNLEAFDEADLASVPDICIWTRASDVFQEMVKSGYFNRHTRK